ncbi:hypothetical protein QJS10_CPB22g00697 [Acorus calamus]|uniref:DUF4283 domain-containing protein n=1 Tax=Acorus calamus TaxID=4465 RepID=A0AAV9C0Z6_ACOCL|nr:hypothetical protein QJS10_CPB22g00697 [Acorus calamus]
MPVPLIPPDPGKGLLPTPSPPPPPPPPSSSSSPTDPPAPPLSPSPPPNPSAIPNGNALAKGLLPYPPSSVRGEPSSQRPEGPRPRKQRINIPPPTVCEESKSWSSLFTSPSSKKANTSIDFYAPTIDGPQKLAILEEEEVAEAEASWGNILVGYVWGITPVFTPFLQFIKKLWRPKGEITLSMQGNGFFMICFDLAEDLTHVIEDGPWSMANRPFVIQKWNRSIRLERERLNSIPLWVKFPNLPLHFWSPTCLGKIASLIGIPMYLDTPTALRTRSAYARVCIEVEAGVELPDEVFVEIRNGDREAIKVTYDWKPHACSHCHTFGHEESLCCKKPRFINSTKNFEAIGATYIPEGNSTKTIQQPTSMAPSKTTSLHQVVSLTQGFSPKATTPSESYSPTKAVSSKATKQQSKSKAEVDIPINDVDRMLVEEKRRLCVRPNE